MWINKGFKRYAKNTLWLFSGQIVRLLLGASVSIAIARILGPEQFGTFSYIISIVTLIGVFSSLGMQNVARRELVEFPEFKNEIIGSCFVLSAVSSVACYLLLLFFVFNNSQVSTTELALFAIIGSIILITPFRFVEIWFQSHTRGDLSVLSTITPLVLFAPVKIIVIYLGYSLVWFGYILALESISVALLLVVFFWREFDSILKWRFVSKKAKSLLKNGWPLILSGIAVTVYMRIDQIMLRVIHGEFAVGQYAAVTRISTVFFFVPQILGQSLFPAIVNAKANSDSVYFSRIQKYFHFNALLSYMVVLPVALFSADIINIVFGVEYVGCAEILKIHVWACLFVFMGVARSQFLVAEELYKFSMFCTVSGAILNVFLNILWIPEYSGVGAAWATLCSYCFAAYLSSVLHRRCWVVFKMQSYAIFAFLYPWKIFK